MRVVVRVKAGEDKMTERDEILTELRKTHQHLAMIETCLREMNSDIKKQSVTLGKIVELCSKSTTSSDHQLGRKSEENRREEVETREDESRKKDGRETMPKERKAEDYRKRQMKEG